MVKGELLSYLEMGLCLQSSRACLSVYCSRWNTGSSPCWTSDCLNPGLWIRPKQVLRGAQYDHPEAVMQQQHYFIVCPEHFSAQGWYDWQNANETLLITLKLNKTLNDTDKDDKIWPFQVESELCFFPPLTWMFAVQRGLVSRSWRGCCHSRYR